MTDCYPLIKWREGQEITPRQAARYFRISLDRYEQLERGEGECAPSLAIEISRRTGHTVLPGDLPGGAGPSAASVSGASAPPAPDMDGGEDVGASSPSVRGVRADLAIDGDEHGPKWSCFLKREDDGHRAISVVRAGAGVANLFKLTPEHAAHFGLELIRAALLAARPGSVPA